MPSFSFNEVRTTKKNLIFDEWGATNIRKYLNIKETSQYDWLYRKVLDVTPPDIKKRHSPMFIRFCNYPIIAKYENGHIFAYSISPSGIENTQEYAYCHLQKRKINILSGVHGTIDGTLLSDKSFYQADMAKWKNFSNIKIIDMNTINSNTLSKILNSSDTTICAWCYSERSIDVLKALNLLK